MKTRSLFATVGLILGFFYYFGSMVSGLFDFGCSESHAGGLCNAVFLLRIIFYPIRIIYNLVGNSTGITFILTMVLFTLFGLIVGAIIEKKQKAEPTY